MTVINDDLEEFNAATGDDRLVSRDEVREVMGDLYSDDLFNSIDTDGDGMLS